VEEQLKSPNNRVGKQALLHDTLITQRTQQLQWKIHCLEMKRFQEVHLDALPPATLFSLISGHVKFQCRKNMN
jgi:hypothetical protein